MTRRIPDLLVEKLALGELDKAEAKRVRAELEASRDPRLTKIEQSNAELLEAYPPDSVARGVRHRLENDVPPSAAPWRWVVGFGAVAAAAAVAWWVGHSDPSAFAPGPDREFIAKAEPSLSPMPDTVRVKGDAKVLVHRRMGARSEALSSDDRVAPGDELQVAYHAAGRTQGVILSLDGAGVVTLHWPNTENGETALQKGGPIWLDHSYALDDAPGFERFFLVTGAGRDRLDVAAILAAARTLAASSTARASDLDLPDGLDQYTILLRK